MIAWPVLAAQPYMRSLFCNDESWQLEKRGWMALFS
jgi:hypothetical protein